ncbi:MAG: hypothetical protein WAQ25_01705 [Candidatus Saccharimonas sp.]
MDNTQLNQKWNAAIKTSHRRRIALGAVGGVMAASSLMLPEAYNPAILLCGMALLAIGLYAAVYAASGQARWLTTEEYIWHYHNKWPAVIDYNLDEYDPEEYRETLQPDGSLLIQRPALSHVVQPDDTVIIRCFQGPSFPVKYSSQLYRQMEGLSGTVLFRERRNPDTGKMEYELVD